MSQHEVNQGGSPVPTGGDDVYRLRAARDAALQAAQAAIRDTTRLTRLLTILSVRRLWISCWIGRSRRSRSCLQRIS